MESKNPNGPNYNLRLSSHALESLPKHERPLRIKLGALNNSLAFAPKAEEPQPALNLRAPPADPKVDAAEQKSQVDAEARPPRQGNNVYINVNIFFSKGMPDVALSKPTAEEKGPVTRKSGPGAQNPQQGQENNRKSQEESISPLRLVGRPVDQVKPVKPVNGPSNQISSLFENSQSSDHEHFSPLRKREPSEIKCACHHLHVNDNVKISRFSYKSQLRKIRVRWAGLAGDFPIVFKRKLARFEDDSESVSINEIVDFSKKLIQPEGENDIFEMGEQF